jgi:hypothetical protein
MENVFFSFESLQKKAFKDKNRTEKPSIQQILL